ncbi:MAG: glycosyltransferase family 4 protein [Bacteroidia bacterium]|nr:glycosyltransferase family 4 protein [Bacteroidia bacterium]
MILFVNGRFLTQKTSGVQYYAREICKELIEQCEIKILVPKNAILQPNEFTKHLLPIGSFKGHLWDQINLVRFMKKHKNDTLLNLCNTGPISIKNQIVTIHDLAFVENPKWFHPLFAFVYNNMIPVLVKKAKHILTVSETIKNEITKQYSISSNKITVVGNKVSNELLNSKNIEAFDERIKAKSYFLMVGTNNNPRKNFNFVINAFAELLPNSTLVIAGGNHQSFSQQNNYSAIPSTIIFLDYVTNEKLKWLYKNAIAAINPSLYEGFGIPNIEAMILNCPVICSNIPVFKEVCEDAARYFNNNNQQDFITEVKKCTDNKPETAQLVQKGIARVEYYQQKNRTASILKLINV